MRVDHIGYAVKRLDRGIASFEALGYMFEAPIDDASRNVSLAFGQNGPYRVELVAPLDKSKESPVDTHLSKIGPTPYHICYASDDLENDMAQLAAQGFKVVVQPEQAIAFGGRRVVFMTSLGAGLMEIAESDFS